MQRPDHDPSDTIDGPDTACANSQRMEKTVLLYRMASLGHLCSFRLKSKSLPERIDYTVADNLLTTREETKVRTHNQ